MEIKHFRLIKTIAEEGSLAQSSDKLFLTQSALSHQLRELEVQLGFKVFLRSRNQWTLTEEGQALYQTGLRVLAELEQGLQQVKLLQQGAAGRIRLSTECYSFYQGLPQFIQEMGLLYPMIEVDLMLEATHRPIPKLVAGEIDIALVTERHPDPALHFQELRQDEVFAVLHREHPLADRAFLEPHHFSEAHLIIHSFPLETVSVYRHFLRPNGIEPGRITAIPLSEVALELVAANMGLLCMPKWALRSFRLAPELCFKPLGQTGLKRQHYVVTRKSDLGQRYLQTFLEGCAEFFRDPA
ncbi:MAG: LysR family transcriptional regulator [Phaeodactylibacter sp.]|nr:LysR family transcriptional regulator [Phaeodactylibacter sp.]